MAKKRAEAALQLALELISVPGGLPAERHCLRCATVYNQQASSALYRVHFCSEDCEREFVRQRLQSLSLKDCIRLHRRLQMLTDRIKPPSIAELCERK